MLYPHFYCDVSCADNIDTLLQVNLLACVIVDACNACAVWCMNGVGIMICNDFLNVVCIAVVCFLFLCNVPLSQAWVVKGYMAIIKHALTEQLTHALLFEPSIYSLGQ